jgi:hypothetical protein
MNVLYRAAFTARATYALQVARAVAPLEHSGVKGAIREVLVADLFRPLLPADVGITTGVVISAHEQAQSAQQDIIIFNRRILPPILFSEGPALIPVESALATIEVKSRLSSTELKAAHDNALSLRRLGMLSGTQDKDGKFVDVPTSGVTPLLFALDTDLSQAGQSEKDRYLSLFGEDPPVIRGICVAGRTSWWPTAPAVFDYPSGKYITPDGSPFQNTWKETKADEHHSEILRLLAGLYSLIERVALNRGRPPLKSYLLDSE